MQATLKASDDDQSSLAMLPRRIFGAINLLGGIITIFCTIETKGYDADVVDVQERQERAGYRERIGA